MAENLAQNNYKLKISYDGTRYFGWERQPNKETIQGKIENVLSRMCNTEIEITGAGRTDAGVHAKAMIANVHMNTGMTEDEILEYMNRYLPDDIAVMTVTKASDRFHARYNAKGKTYCYTIFNGKVKPVFNRKYYTFIEEKLDVEAMREAFVKVCDEQKIDIDKTCIKQSKDDTSHGTLVGYKDKKQVVELAWVRKEDGKERKYYLG